MGPKLPMLFAAFCWVHLLLGCGSREGESGVLVENPWARAMLVGSDVEGVLPGTNSAVYLSLRNLGRTPDRLLGAESPVAVRVEVHESLLDGDVMRMRRVGGVDLPPGRTVELAPGGIHIMLLDLRRSLNPGDTLSLTLNFRNAPAISLTVPVRRDM